jgi:hypothetical protein
MIIDNGSQRPSAHAHRVIRDMAVDMAHQLYDTMMQDNEWYALWKRLHPRIADQPRQLEAAFVRRNLARMLPQARAMVAGALAKTTDAELANSLYEALTLDATLTRGRPGAIRPAAQLLT